MTASYEKRNEVLKAFDELYEMDPEEAEILWKLVPALARYETDEAADRALGAIRGFMAHKSRKSEGGAN